MSTAPRNASAMPASIPDDFFKELPSPPQTSPRGVVPGPGGQMRALVLYDAIIDDLIAHPGANITDTGRRLGRSPATLRQVVSSDFFRFRWLQRRETFNEQLNFRLTTKMAQVAEESLDLTLQVLKKKGDTIPLPLLDNMNKNILDRLGYGVTGGAHPAMNVVVNTQNNNSNSPSAAAANAQASPAGLAEAQKFLKILEERNASFGPSPGNAQQVEPAGGPVVEGVSHRVEP